MKGDGAGRYFCGASHVLAHLRSRVVVSFVLVLVWGGGILGRAQPAMEHTESVAGRPASTIPLFLWNVDDLTTHQFDASFPGAKEGSIAKRHLVFYPNGSFAQDATPAGGGAAVHTVGNWKIYETDLELRDGSGTLLDYWRLVKWNEKQGHGGRSGWSGAAGGARAVPG